MRRSTSNTHRYGVVASIGLALVGLTASILIAAPPASARGLTVTATPDTTSVEMGQRITISGILKPGKSGVRVTAEELKGGRWKAVKDGRTSAKGAYSLAVLPIKPGGYQLRVSAKDSRGRTLGSSAPFDAVALQWHYLSDLKPVQEASLGHNASGSVRISGTTYPHSFSIGPRAFSSEGWAEFDLRRSCTRFEAVAGIDDSSPANSVHVPEVIADGGQLFSQQVELGMAVPVSLGIDGHLRLRLNDAKAKEGLKVAFGDARILCAF